MLSSCNFRLPVIRRNNHETAYDAFTYVTRTFHDGKIMPLKKYFSFLFLFVGIFVSLIGCQADITLALITICLKKVSHRLGDFDISLADRAVFLQQHS